MINDHGCFFGFIATTNSNEKKCTYVRQILLSLPCSMSLFWLLGIAVFCFFWSIAFTVYRRSNAFSRNIETVPLRSRFSDAVRSVVLHHLRCSADLNDRLGASELLGILPPLKRGFRLVCSSLSVTLTLVSIISALC